MRLGFFQQRYNQFSFDAGETIQKILNGVARFKMIK